jgi:DMSO/TMAO reductase YedYZ heme-binding membrane subunit
MKESLSSSSRRRSSSAELRTRFWIECVLTALSGFLLVLTFFWRDWIEAFGFDPDSHNGSLEWMIVGVLVVLTLAFAVLTRAEWHRHAGRGTRALSGCEPSGCTEVEASF